MDNVAELEKRAEDLHARLKELTAARLEMVQELENQAAQTKARIEAWRTLDQTQEGLLQELEVLKGEAKALQASAV